MKISIRKLVNVIFFISIFYSSSYSQNRIFYNGQNLFLNGANLAWVNFANDIGPGVTDYKSFADILLTIHDHGGNAVRWWLHTNGAVTPEFNDSNFVVGPGTGTIQDIRKVLDLAWEREVGVVLCLWSFDMLQSSNSEAILNRNNLMLTDTNYTRAYINNSLIPMVDSLKGHPAIIAWEIFNEPEGMSNEFGWINHRVPMSAIQRFVNLCSGAIHREDSTALVTNGAWSFKSCTDISLPAKISPDNYQHQVMSAEKYQMAEMFKQKNRISMSVDDILNLFERISATPNQNYYSDSSLVEAGGDPKGTLDFYSVHYYPAIDPYNPNAISPFYYPSGHWGLNKPIVVAEFWMIKNSNVPKELLFESIYQKSYAGALAWSWTDNQVTQVSDIISNMQYMWDYYPQDVDVNGISGDWPTVSITSPENDAEFSEGSDVTITADASDKDGTVVSVEFFVSDTVKIGEVDNEPFSYVWKNISPGLYNITAVATDNSGNKRTSEMINIKIGTPQMTRLEAEKAALSGSGITIKTDPNASNRSFIDIATNDSNATITWTLQNVPEAGTYTVAFGYKLAYDSPKSQYINVNGERVDTLEFTAPSVSSWYEKETTVNLVPGENTIAMQMFWGWMQLDYLSVPNSLATGVEEIADIPKDFKLNQNYPNPFNPTTKISYRIAKPGLVTLKIYDILGREAATLINEEKSAGNYDYVLNADNLPNGRRLSSGVYFYRLTSGNFADTKKFILLK